MFAIKRDFEAEELRKPKRKGPTSRERRLKPPRQPREHLDSVLGGRITRLQVDPAAFPSLEGGTRAALTLLRSQPDLYAIVALHQTRHIVTPGDLLTTYNLRDTRVGDVIRFTRIEEVGSRDYTLRLTRPPLNQVDDSHYFASDAVEVCGVVVEHTRGKVKYTWRRGYHYRHLRAHVNHLTRIRIGEIKLGAGEGAPSSVSGGTFAQTWCVPSVPSVAVLTRLHRVQAQQLKPAAGGIVN
jgi:large subunit ribosomal protein L21